MIGVAALWIVALLLIGGFALDRVLSRSIVDSFDNQLVYILNSMIDASEIGPDGEVRFSRAAGRPALRPALFGTLFPDQRRGRRALPVALAVGPPPARRRRPFRHEAPSLRQRRILRAGPRETLRIAERDVILPGSSVRWRFQVAESRDTIDKQIHDLRSILIWSFSALGVGLLVLAALQTFYGLWPLRRVRREVAAIRSGDKKRSAATSRPRSGR